MNTNNGGLFFEIDFNIEEIQKKVNDIQREAMKMGGIAEQQGNKLDSIFSSITGSAGSVEKALQAAGSSMEDLFNGNVLQNLKNANIELGLTGQELKEAAREADRLVYALDNALQQNILETKDALDKINQMPEGSEKQRLMFDLAGETVEIEKAAATLQQMKDFIADVKEESKSLAQRLGEITQEMQRLDAAGQRDSDRYEELRKKAIDYSESIQRVNDEIKIVTKGDALGGLMSVANAVSSAFSIGAGVVGLFAKENENLAAIQQRVQSITAIAVGVTQAYNDVSREGSTIVAGLTKVQEFFIGVQNRLATAFNLSEKAARGWTMALSVGVFAAVTAVIYLYEKYSEEMERAQRAQKALNEAALEGAKNAAQEVTQLQLLYAAATDVTRSLEDRKKAVDKLQAQYPSYFKNLSDEAILAGNAANSYRKLRAEIIAASQAKAAQGKIDKINEDFLEREEKLKAKMLDAAKRARKPQASVEYDYTTGQPLRNVSAEENKRKAVAEFKAYTAELTNLYRERNRTLDPLIKYTLDKENAAANFLNDQEKPKKVADNSMGKRLSVIKKRLQELKAQGKEGTAEFKNLLEEAKKLDSTIDEINETIDPKPPKKPKSAKPKSDKPKSDKPDKKNPQDVAEEILPAGSVAEIQKRLRAIDEALSKANDVGIIEALKKRKIDALKELAEAQKRIAIEGNDKEAEARAEAFKNWLQENESFEQQRERIAREAAERRSQIEKDSTLSPDQKRQYTDAANREEMEKTSTSALNQLVDSDLWTQLYENIDNLTVYQIDRLLQELEAKAPELTKLMTPTDFNSIINSFKQAKQRIEEQNPFAGMVLSFRDLMKSFREDTDEGTAGAAEKFDDLTDSVIGVFGGLSKGIDQMGEFREYLSEGANEALDSIQMFAGLAITVVTTTKTAIKGISQGIKNAELSSVILAILQIVMVVIKAVIQLVTWFARLHDKKLEKNIKSHRAELESLKTAYDDLGDAIKNALGDNTRKLQLEQIKNLQQQNREIEKMRNAEDKKKKTDKQKLADYDSQLRDNKSKINDLHNEIIRNILQTDAKDAAGKLGDALVDAFSRGEDASKSMRETALTMIQDIAKNMVKMKIQEMIAPKLQGLLHDLGFNDNGEGSFITPTQEMLTKFQNEMEVIGASMKPTLDSLGFLLKAKDDAKAQGLKGDIKGVSEKTAGALEAQINAMRVNQVAGIEVMRNSLLQLSQIESNTRNLIQIRKDISEINQKTKTGLAGI